MFKYETSLFINRPPQQVWDFLIEPANTPRWRGNIVSAEWIGTPGASGSAIHEIQKLMGKNVETTNVVTEWDPPRRFAYQSEGAVNGKVYWTFTPQAGGTVFTLHIELELKGLVNKVLEITGMFARFIDTQNKTDFAKLKTILEEK